MHANITYTVMLCSNGSLRWSLLSSSISLSIIGVSNEAQTGSVEGTSLNIKSICKVPRVKHSGFNPNRKVMMLFRLNKIDINDAGMKKNV